MKHGHCIILRIDRVHMVHKCVTVVQLYVPVPSQISRLCSINGSLKLACV